MSRRVVVGLGLLCLVLVSVMLAVVARSHPGVAPTPTPTGSAQPRLPLDQQGMLVAVRSEGGDIVDALVLAARSTGASTAASAIQVQPGLGLQFVDSGTVTLATSGSESPQSLQDRLAGQLGIYIPNGLVLDRLAFAALIDAAGGVVVDIPKTIYGRNAAGRRVVLFAPGVQRLYGPAAADFAAYLGPGEEESIRMARFASVWAQTVTGLPSDETHMRNAIGSLGVLARNSTPVGVMATELLNYQRAQREGALRSGSLPATATGTGAKAIFTPDPEATATMSRDLFPALQSVAGLDGVPERIRIVGVGADQMQLVEAGDRLARLGMEVVCGGYAQVQAASTIYAPRKGAALAAGRQVGEELGLPGNSVTVDPMRAAGVSAAVWAADDLFPEPTPSPSASGTVSPHRAP